jgi:hypothetical protein
MAKLSFAQAVDAWTSKSKARMEAVFKESFDITLEQVRMATPVDTGFLVNSLTVTLGGIASVDQTATGKPGGRPYRAPIAPAVIDQAKLGDTLSAGFVASYGQYVEYGARGRPGAGMVRLGVQNWQMNVDEAIRRAKAAVR